MTANPVDAVLVAYDGVLTSLVRHSIAAWLADHRIDPASFTRTLRAWLSRDAEPNVIGTRNVGLQALLHVDPASTCAAPAGLVPALTPHPTGVTT